MTRPKQPVSIGWSGQTHRSHLPLLNVLHNRCIPLRDGCASLRCHDGACPLPRSRLLEAWQSFHRMKLVSFFAEQGPPLRCHSSHVPGDAAVTGCPLQQHLQPLAQHGGHISVDARVAFAAALLRLELQHHGGEEHAAGRGPAAGQLGKA